MRYKAFLLDWDGTIIDSLLLKLENAGNLFAARYGVNSAAAQICYRRYSGIPRRQLFDRIALDLLERRLADEEFDRLSSEFTELNLKVLRTRAQLKSEARATLTTLRSRGVIACISTSVPATELELLVSHFQLQPLLHELLGSRPGFGKGPEHAAFVAEKYQLQLAEIAGVGDEPRDIELHHAATIGSIGITGTETRQELLACGANIVIDRLDELINYV
ncbi:MAG: HAD family hydrolase [Anaerolineae bacterium]|nr:HAD family hydrolase [Anaerolineae bacterium]